MACNGDKLHPAWEKFSSCGGADGKSAYDVYVDQQRKEGANPLSEAGWLESLKGRDGVAGEPGASGTDGVDGVDGKSAYGVYVDQLGKGVTLLTESEWLESLKGEDAADIDCIECGPRDESSAFAAELLSLDSSLESLALVAEGGYSIAMGVATSASGDGSTAMGVGTRASGEGSTAMGGATVASDGGSTAMGGATVASGPYSTAMGGNTTASGSHSTAMGYRTTASGEASIAIGTSTVASGNSSTAMGKDTRVGLLKDINDSLERVVAASDSLLVHYNTFPDDTKDLEKWTTIFAVRLNEYTEAMKQLAVVQKLCVVATPKFSDPKVLDLFRTIEGLDPPLIAGAPTQLISGDSVFNEFIAACNAVIGLVAGAPTQLISGDSGLATGNGTIAYAKGSTAIGSGTAASGEGSTAMGGATVASGAGSTAMGSNTAASGKGSTAMGVGTRASGEGSTAMGKYNVDTDAATDLPYLLSVGNGTAVNARSNALAVTNDGLLKANAGLDVTGGRLKANAGLRVEGGAAVTGRPLIATSGLGVTGPANVDGNASLNGVVRVGGLLNASAGIDVAGNAKVRGNLQLGDNEPLGKPVRSDATLADLITILRDMGIITRGLGGSGGIDVMLTDVGPNKAAVITVVGDIRGLGAADAAAIVDGVGGIENAAVPALVIPQVNQAEANTAKAKLEAAGAKVNLISL